MLGSVIFRSVQFSSYEAFFTATNNNEFVKNKIPFSGGIEWRVVLGGVFSGTCRAVLECPFEYAKVKRQTGQSWQMNEIYRGFSACWPRGVGMMTIYFCMVDSIRRRSNLWDYKLG